ncbi:MAG: DUF1802 family protein [Phycisphaeraceae bacterium]|nr:DUF1802 family protein [Phycisphaeraceae bacterium]
MLTIALKEWAVVCDLLVEGGLAIVLRKGGIHEEGGPGRFKLEVERFALFPAWEHQDPRKLKQAYQSRVKTFGQEPSELLIRGYAEAARIWQVPSREAFDQLDDLHCWTSEQIDMRFNYKPDRPIYLLALRAFRLPDAKLIANQPRYAGCKSWVDLDEADAIDESGAMPAMSDDAFAALLERIEKSMATDGHG